MKKGLTPLQDDVDVLVREGGTRGLHDLIGAELDHVQQLVLRQRRVLVRQSALHRRQRKSTSRPSLGNRGVGTWQPSGAGAGTCWITAASRKSFLSARSTIFSSTVPSVTKRNTRTCFV